MVVNRPKAFWGLLIVVCLLAGTALGVVVDALDGRIPGAVITLAVVGGLSEVAFSTRIRDDVTASLGSVVVLVGLAYAGAPGAIAAAVGSSALAAWHTQSDRVVKTIFNVGSLTCSAMLSSLAFSLLAGTDLWVPDPQALLESPVALGGALVTAALVHLSLNQLLLAMVLHLTAGVPFRATMSQLVRELFIAEFPYMALAGLAFVLLVQVGAIALVLLIAPVLLARQTLQSVKRQEDAFDRMVFAFVKAIELKDGYTRGHGERVGDLSVRVAERMGLSWEVQRQVWYGAILHDVGKIGVSLGVLCKAGPLTDEEYDEMKLHPEIGAELLADIDFLESALTIIHHHHERLDGHGYPDQLTEDEITPLTRIVTAVDAFDAMTSTRSYRSAMSVADAIGELDANVGTQFDREVVEHLKAAVDEDGWNVTDEPVQSVITRNEGGR